MNGIIVVNKERGYSSHDVIAVLRGVLHTRKMGHTGTLDPEAEGVLPVCLGYATKICDHLMAQKKEYIAHGYLGVTTDTQDIHGTVIAKRDVSVTRTQMEEAVASFVGEIRQLTPMYSARKVGGVKLVDLARRGIDIERSEKTVRIFEAELLSFDEETGEYDLRVLCQKGTYIRTLCNDIGEKLGCGSCMGTLVRTATGQLKRTNSYTIDELRDLMNSGRIEEALIPIVAMYRGCPPKELAEVGWKALRNGNPLEPEWLSDCAEPLDERFLHCYENLLGDSEAKCIRVYAAGEFYAIYKKKGRRFVPLQMYHEVDNEINHAMRLQNEKTAAAGCCLAVGKFDGLHRGHRSLIGMMNSFSVPKVLLSVVAEDATREIYTEAEMKTILKDLGIDRMIVWPLTKEHRNMDPEAFLRDVCIGEYHAKQIVVGADFRFGKDRSGTAVMLKELSERYGIGCVICPMAEEDGAVISSSRIREALSAGEMETVNKLLGAPYHIVGEIVHGKEIGHLLGFPTINFLPSEGKLLPQFGVYHTQTTMDGKVYNSVTNIGDNPTVTDGIVHPVTVETHLIDYEGDCYGRSASVAFLSRIRGQVRFDSLKQLSAQLAADVQHARESSQNGSFFVQK